MHNATVLTQLTVSQIVRDDYRTADVFKKWGINYCCGGNLPLADVCRAKDIDAAAVEADLAAATKTVQLSNTLQFNQWPVTFLLDYIVNVHHAYLRQTIPSLSQHLSSFVAGHLKKYPYLVAVEETFLHLAAELIEHTQTEEESIFPYLRQISNTFDRKEVYGSLFVRTLRKPLAETVRKDHERIGRLLLALREQTDDYRLMADACTNHQVIYHKLKEFDADLMQHKHLENNVLYPNVLEMEKALLQV